MMLIDMEDDIDGALAKQRIGLCHSKADSHDRIAFRGDERELKVLIFDHAAPSLKIAEVSAKKYGVGILWAEGFKPGKSAIESAPNIPESDFSINGYSGYPLFGLDALRDHFLKALPEWRYILGGHG